MRVVLLLILSLLLTSFKETGQVSDAIKKKMRHAAFATRRSLYRHFVVVKVKNKNTGELKEICVTPNYIAGALYAEDGLFHFGLEQEYKKGYFEFSKDSALMNLGFYEYSSVALDSFRNAINVDSIVSEIRAKKMKCPQLRNGQQLRYFAHIMFDHGVITNVGCFVTRVWCF